MYIKCEYVQKLKQLTSCSWMAIPHPVEQKKSKLNHLFPLMNDEDNDKER